MGLLSEPLQISCVMGVTGGIRPTPRNLAHMAEQVPGGAEGPNNWGVIGISRDQWRLVAAAAALGGNVRVGLEDNFYLPDGEMARSNGDLIAKARQIVENAGRRVATRRRGARAARHAEGGWRRERRARGRPGPRPLAAPAGRLLLAAAGRLRRRRAEGRGHRHGRLRPLGAARTTRAPRTRPSPRCSSRSTAASARSGSTSRRRRGREVLLRLVREYDVLLESFRPGVMDRLGVGYERLREENPRLVYCAITGYGQDGPYTRALRPRHELPGPDRAARPDRRAPAARRCSRPARSPTSAAAR